MIEVMSIESQTNENSHITQHPPKTLYSQSPNPTTIKEFRPDYVKTYLKTWITYFSINTSYLLPTKRVGRLFWLKN